MSLRSGAGEPAMQQEWKGTHEGSVYYRINGACSSSLLKSFVSDGIAIMGHLDRLAWPVCAAARIT